MRSGVRLSLLKRLIVLAMAYVLESSSFLERLFVPAEECVLKLKDDPEYPVKQLSGMELAFIEQYLAMDVFIAQVK